MTILMDVTDQLGDLLTSNFLCVLVSFMYQYDKNILTS